MSVADHNIVPGKKFWTWATSQRQAMDTTLTDDDGPYIELMVGAYSDNQPDYSWLQPYEAGRSACIGTRSAILAASKGQSGCRREPRCGRRLAKVGFYCTSAHSAARVVLKAGDQALIDEIGRSSREALRQAGPPCRRASTNTT